MRINAEQLIGKTLAWTFPLYALGALYIVGPVLGWSLLMLVIWQRQIYHLHPLVWVWVAGMAMMEVALVVAHINVELPLTSMIKSSIGWAKGWALIALFIAAGALLRTPDALWRGACYIGACAMCITPLLIVASFAGLPEALYVSPLKIIGGSGPEYFEVRLYEMDTGFGLPRLRYYTPWAPAAGLVGNILLLMSLQERDMRWRIIGAFGCFVMIIMSLSRLGWLISLSVPTLLFALRYCRQPALWFAAVPAVFFVGMILPLVLPIVETAKDNLLAARADSTMVRAWLAEIALQRWQTEAPIWGHGIVETGPHLVQFMPIGSHHSWLGLLFVKGIVGAIALAVPLFATTVYLAANAIRSDIARVALGVMLVLSLYTFGENLEILSYLYWPGLLVVGHALAKLRITP